MKITRIEEHPEFTARDKHSVWIFKLDREYTYQSNLTGHNFAGEWLRILPDGKIIIPKGYAWNGCSPKFSILDAWILGTPDGIIDIETGKPKTYHASLVHDALYQYFEWHDVSRKDIDKLFHTIMLDRKFKAAGIYFSAVRLFGGFVLREKHPERGSVEFGVEGGE